MTAKVTAAEPPHKIPESMRKGLHQYLDDLLNEYEWDQRSLHSSYVWESPESSGRVRMTTEELRW